MKANFSSAPKTLGLVWIVCISLSVFSDTGITFVDIKKQGTNPDSTYYGDTECAELHLSVKDKEGHRMTALIDVKFTKKKTYSQMAADLAAAINAAAKANCWTIKATVSDNSVTVTGTIFEDDPAADNPITSSNDRNDPHYSKVTRKVPTRAN